MIITIMTSQGGSGRPPTQWDRVYGIRVTAMKWPKIVAPATITMTMQLKRVVSAMDFRKFCQDNCRRITDRASVKKAPVAAASVGVKKPKNNPPITNPKINMASIMPDKDLIFCKNVVFGPGGASSGFFLT